MSAEQELVLRIDRYHRNLMTNAEQVDLYCELHNMGMISNLDGAWERGMESLVSNGYITLRSTDDGLWAEPAGIV